MTDAETVFDASALLAVLRGETGAEHAVPLLSSAIMSTANWSEVIARLRGLGAARDTASIREDVEGLGVEFVPVSVWAAERAAEMSSETRSLGLSLGDRLCLALAEETARPAVTADKAWGKLGALLPHVPVQLIR